MKNKEVCVCLPQKAELFYLIPAIRKELIRESRKFSLKQSEAAKILGLTKSAASKYFHEKRASLIDFSKEMKKEIEKSAEQIFKNGKNANSEIVKLLGIAKKIGFTCKICKGEYK